MNAIQRIAKNIGMIGISQIIVNILAFILLIYIARYLGAEQFGIYSFAVSFTTLFVVFADIGISQLLIRDIARNKTLTSEYFTSASLIKLLLSFITFGLIAFSINLMNYPSNVVYIVYLFGIYTILTSFAYMFMSLFQAFEQMEYVAAVNTIEKLIVISLGLYILSSGYGLIELSYVYVFAGIVNVIISILLVLVKVTKPIKKIRFSLLKTITIESIPFGLNTLFGMMFFKIDTILLSILQNETAVGIYNAAYNPLLAFGTVLTNMVVTAIFPVMSKYFISSKESLEKFTLLLSKYMAIMGFPIAVGSFILADRFIELFYAGQYTDSIIAFQILALFIPIRLISSITGTLLTSINKQGVRTLSFFFSAIFNILLNLVLIPSFSFVGASIATVLSEIFLYCLLLYFIGKYYIKIKLHNFFIKPMVASIIMGVLILLLKEINLIVLIVLSTLFYFFMLLILKTFTKEDMFILKQILRFKI